MQDEGGECRASGTENHPRPTADAILLAHNGGAGLTCIKRVTVDGIYGHESDVPPPVLAVMRDLDYQGAGKGIPPRVLHFVINRLVCCVMDLLLPSMEYRSGVQRLFLVDPSRR